MHQIDVGMKKITLSKVPYFSYSNSSSETQGTFFPNAIFCIAENKGFLPKLLCAPFTLVEFFMNSLAYAHRTLGHPGSRKITVNHFGNPRFSSCLSEASNFLKTPVIRISYSHMSKWQSDGLQLETRRDFPKTTKQITTAHEVTL